MLYALTYSVSQKDDQAISKEVVTTHMRWCKTGGVLWHVNNPSEGV